ncbi:MAG: hypothetical protein ACE5E4_08560 [Candidatus Binatia bacterium]
MGRELSIDGFESVVAWRESLRAHWGGDPLAEDPDKLRALEGFCRFVEKTPDELVAYCFLRRRDSGERFASKKRREELMAKLKNFASSSGLPVREARRSTSNVLSFLTHNGVLI